MSLPVSIDDLEMAIGDLSSALACPISERGPQWAHDVCTYTRFVHLNVWDTCPPEAKVEKEIIRLMSQASNELTKVDPGKFTNDDINKIDDYKTNIDFRLYNLGRYLKGLPPLPDPHDPQFRRGDKSL